MSKIALKPNDSGTGTFTIESPPTNTNRTLTLPDVSGTVATEENLPPGYTDQDALDLFNASGNAPVYACRAWVSWSDPTTIRGSGNVSSITRLGVGFYQINFNSSIVDSNFAAVAVGSNDAQANFPTVAVLEHSISSVRARFANNLIAGTSDQTRASLVVLR